MHGDALFLAMVLAGFVTFAGALGAGWAWLHLHRSSDVRHSEELPK